MDRALRWMRRLAMAVLLLGMLLRLTVRDEYPLLSTVFYGLPLPVVAGGWLGLAATYALGIGGKRSLLTGLCCMALTIGSAWWWHATSYLPPRAVAASTSKVKVMFWNLAHRPLPHATLLKLVQEQQPDIAGFVETGRMSGDPNPLVDPLPAGYQALKCEHGTAVIVRGTARQVQERKLPSYSKYVEVELTVDSQKWRLFIVDGVSSPIRSREDVLKEVLAEAKDHERTLIMGDFNTPRESSWFAPWREAFHHAYDEAGTGWSETWPRQSPVALLSIDHIWSSRELLPQSAEKIWSPASDHAALLVTY